MSAPASPHPAAPACPQCGKPATLLRFLGEVRVAWEEGHYNVYDFSGAKVRPVLLYGCGCYETGHGAAVALLTLVGPHIHA